MKLNHYNVTRTFTSPIAITLLAAIACALLMFAQPQAARGQSLTTAPTGREVYSWAKETQQKLPALETWDRARPTTETDRSLVMYVKRGHAIVNRVIERGARMSAKEAANYDAQMRIVM